MERYNRPLILIEIQESSFASDNWFNGHSFSLLNQVSEALFYFGSHRDISCTGICFRRFELHHHIAVPQKLPCHMDAVFLEIDIRHRQPTEFRDTKSCVQQDIYAIVVSAVMGMLMDEAKKLFFLLLSQCMLHNFHDELQQKSRLAIRQRRFEYQK